MSSDAALERLKRLHPRLIDLSLGRIERLLAALGHPERRLAPVVHVAGTNGKGSVVATLKAIAEAAGLAVHVYTSPHLVRFHERIAVRGAPIGEAALTAALDACERANREQPITFFEVTTAAAFLAFADTPADLVLLETGLGGRLDATNVIDRPALCTITPVSIDHREFLGDTLAAIAGEKAGILKPGVPAVIARQQPAAEAVIAGRARDIGAPLLWQGSAFDGVETEAGMRYRDPQGARDLPRPALYGPHQVDNAAVAIACARTLGQSGIAIDDRAVAAGLSATVWPARLQRLGEGSLAERLGLGFELWLDGGHNEAAGRMLGEVAQGWRDRPLHLVYGMLKTKDAAGFLAPLARHATRLWAVPIPGEAAAMSADEAAAAASRARIPSETARSPGAALDAIAAGAAPGRVLICGSLYLAGQVLTQNGRLHGG